VSRRRRIVLAVLMIGAVSQIVFSGRRDRARETARRDALAAVATERDAMRREASADARAARDGARDAARDAQKRAREARRDAWLADRGITINGNLVIAGFVLLGGVWVAMLRHRPRYLMRRQTGCVTPRCAINAPATPPTSNADVA
jgi:hypothetical protein